MISVAIDVDAQLLYMGSIGGGYGDNDPNLYQYDISSGARETVAVGSTVVGITVDQGTGYVYLTTFTGGSRSDSVVVYDGRNLTSSSSPVWDNSGDIGNPAGIVCGGDVVCKYGIGTIDKSPSVIEGSGAVSPLDPNADEITYTITFSVSYTEPSGQAIDTSIVDELPRGVDFVQASDQGIYDPESHEVSWYLGDVSSGYQKQFEGGQNTLTVKVSVNEDAAPGSLVKNYCRLESNTRIAWDEDETVNVAWWSAGKILYVNDLSPKGDGLSWETAYNIFHDALDHALNNTSIEEIWVADGFYNPGFDSSDTFQLVEDVKVYGGFSGNESSLDERDLSKNNSILTGSGYADYVVTGASNSVLDGFVIKHADDAGIYCDSSVSNMLIQNDKIVYNDGMGVYCQDASDVTIHNCSILQNLNHGICCENGGGIITISNCRILQNSKDGQGHGIHCSNCNEVRIRNNWICNNSSSGIYVGSDGVYIQNNTIAYNNLYGIHKGASQSPAPIITNTIVWGNNDGYDQFCNMLNPTDNVTYCCIEGGFSYGTNIIDQDPCFVAPGSYNYCLISGVPGSPCIDSGDPSSSVPDDETDILGQARVVGDAVDMGAYEYPPIRVFAGEDRIVTLSTVTEDVDVVLNDSELYSVDDNISVDDLSVSWSELVDGSFEPLGITSLHPSLAFTEEGTHVFMLEVKEDTTVIGRDFVVVQVYIGIELNANPSIVKLPGTSELSASYTPASPSELNGVQWFGPPNNAVSFDPCDTSLEPVDVTFNAGPGKYEFVLQAHDSAGYVIGEQNIWVPVSHPAITVIAKAEPATIQLPDNRVYLSGSVIGAMAAKTTWEVPEAAEEIARVEKPNDLNTWIEFSESGEYEIALVVEDQWGYVIGVDIVKIIVNSPAVIAPVVDAGEDQVVDWDAGAGQVSVFLSGTVSGSYDQVRWYDPTGGYVTFGNSNSLFTSAIFTQPGRYPIQLLAEMEIESEMVVVSADTVFITVNFPQITVDAGADQEVAYGTPVDLSGVVSGGGYSSVQWFDYSGYATFLDGSASARQMLQTAVFFAYPGTYSLGLVALDVNGDVLAGDAITITVKDVVVDAGPDREITFSENTYANRVTLRGQVLEGAAAAVKWELPSGMLPCNHGNLNEPDTWIEFPEPGIYMIGLAALGGSDALSIIGWDTVRVIVHPQTPPVVNVTIKSYVETTETYEIIMEGNSDDDKVTLEANVQGGTVTQPIVEWIGPKDDDYGFSNEEGAYPDYNADVIFYDSGIYQFGFIVREGAIAGEPMVGFGTVTVTARRFHEVPYEITWTKETVLFGGGSPTAEADLGCAIVTGETFYLEWIDPTGKSVISPANSSSAVASLASTATFDEVGKYDILLLVREDDANGEILDTREVSVLVHPEGYTSFIVDAGEDQEFTLPPTGAGVVVDLAAIVSAVGGGAVDIDSIKWIDPSDESIVFDDGIEDNGDDDKKLETKAIFDTAGEYHLGLVVTNTSGTIVSDEVVITINRYNNKEAYVDAGADQQINLLETNEVLLTGYIESSYCDTVEWFTSDPSVPISPANSRQAKATFTKIGDYHIRLYAKCGENVIGWDDVKVSVRMSDVIVDATIAGQDGYWSDDNVIETPGLQLTGTVEGVSSGDYIVYAWSVVDGDDSVVDITHGESNSPDASVSISQGSRYILRLEAQYNNEPIGWDHVSIYLAQPKVDTGEYGPIAMTSSSPEYLTVSGQIWGVTVPADYDNIFWSIQGGDGQEPSVSPASGTLNPTVTFYQPGIYTLTMSYNENGDDNVEAQKSTTIVVEESVAYVDAGPNRTAYVGRHIFLDEAVVMPPLTNLTYEWRILESELPDGATMYDAIGYDLNTLSPEVWFLKPGPYTLVLNVWDENDDYFGHDMVVIDVKEYHLPDEKDPEITSFRIWEGGWEGTGTELFDDPDPCDVYNDLYIEVIAEDSHLDNIYLELDGERCSVAASDYEVLKGSNDNPEELRLRYILNPHSITTGPHALVAYATDRVNKASGNSIFNFECNCIIQSFIVDDEVATSGDPCLAFSATLSGNMDWELNIGGQLCGSGELQSSVNVEIDFEALGFEDGSYTAVLTVSGDTAELPIWVHMDESSEGTLQAEFDTDLKIEPETLDNVEVPIRKDENKSNAIFTINSAVCNDLKARAWDSVFPDNIYVRFQVFDPSILYMSNAYEVEDIRDVKYLHENWNAYYSSLKMANVSSGELDETGFVRMSLGSETTYGQVGRLDFSGLENGVYVLLMTVERRLGTDIQIEYDHLDFALDCPLKLGNVKFSQEDLSIDLGGYPLRVIRSYDSFKRNIKGDFGYGWSYSIADLEIKLNESRSRTVAPTQRRGDSFTRDVTLTLPDTGQRVTFCSYLDADPAKGNSWILSYEAPSYVDAELAVVTDDHGGIKNLIYDAGSEAAAGKGLYWEGYESLVFADDAWGLTYVPTELWPHDVAGYDLTLKDGSVYHIRRKYYKTVRVINDGVYGGIKYKYPTYGKPYLESITLPDDAAVKFTIDLSDGEHPVTKGVEYWAPGADEPTKSLCFELDQQTGFIKEIYPPSEASEGSPVPYVKYNYDIYSNLKSVEKLVDRSTGTYETTTFVYEGSAYVPADHYVTEIRDPRGLSPIRYVYDESGRLTATIDAKGNRIEIRHNDTDERYPEVVGTEEVTDRSGNVTIYGYDERGNVVLVDKFDASDVVVGHTEYVYDKANYPDKPTEVKVALVASPVSNDDYSITITDYNDDYGWPEVVCDPELNVTETDYGSVGNVLAITQWEPNESVTSFDDFPTYYTEISTRRNWYDDQNRLVFTGTTTGNISSPTWHDLSVNYYDSQNRLIHTVQVDVDSSGFSFSTFNSCINNPGQDTDYFDSIISLADNGSDDHVVTSYVYSGTSHQPEKVSDPYFDSDTAVYNKNFVYDDDGHLLESWYGYDSDHDSTIDEYVYNINEYDAQGRVIETWRIIDETEPRQTPYVSEELLSETVYNSIGKVDQTFDEYGNSTDYDYDELGNLVETRTYDPAQNLLTTSRTLYDADGRVLVSVGPYDPSDTDTQPIGTENVYDELGRVVKTRRWEGVQIELIEFWVDIKGDYGPKGKMYEGNAIPVSDYVGLKVPAGVTVGNADDGSFAVGWMVWDETAQDYVIPTEGDELSYTRTEYDFAGRVYKSIVLDESKAEQETEYHYDKAGRQIEVIDPNEDSTVTVYDGTQRYSVTDVAEHTTYFFYDALGRIIKTQHPNTDYIDESGTSQTDQALYTHIGYDGLGRKEWESQITSEPNAGDLGDAEGLKWYDYDAAGRLTCVTLPKPETGDDHPIYRYMYDDYGNQVGILDPLDRLTVFEYDHAGRQTVKYIPFIPTNPTAANIDDAADVYTALSNASPAPDAEFRTYDELGRLETMTDYEGHYQVLTYNDLGQLTHNRYYESSAHFDSEHETYNANPEISYTYDNLGRKVSETVTNYDSGGTGTLIYYNDTYYDAESRIDYLDSIHGMVDYDYHPVTGRKTLVQTPLDGSDSKIDYDYDELGRLEMVTCDLRNGVDVDETTQYTYTANGSLKSTLYPNGNYAEYDYDAIDRLIDLTNWATNQKQTVRSSFAYTLYADGQRSSVTEADGTMIDWTYDNLNRLLTETYDAPGTSNDYTDTYVYDLTGNRFSRNDGSNITYSFYNASDHLTRESLNSDGSSPTIQYSYDDNGSMTEKAVTGGSTSTYQYNFQNRLASVDNGTNIVYYEYNPDGVRIHKQIAGGQTTDYLIDPQNYTGYPQVFTETTGSTPTSYTIGTEIISQGQGTANPRYLLRDGHHSVRQTADTSGAITGSYHFDAYGRLLAHSDTPSTDILYVGQMWDTHADFYNNWHRWYSPATGRFNRMDDYSGSNVDPQSLHKYTYCHGNPIGGIDPTGMNFFALLGQAVHREIENMYMSEHPGNIVYIEKGIPGANGALKPDIMDFTFREIAEIKPLSIYGVTTGHPTLGLYLFGANRFVGGGWSYSKWDIGIRNVSVPYPDWVVVTLGNAYGVVFYKAVRIPRTELKVTLTAASLAMMKKMLEESVRQLEQAARYGSGAIEGLVYAIEGQVEAAVRLTASNSMAYIAVPAITTMIAADLMARVNLSFVTRGLW